MVDCAMTKLNYRHGCDVVANVTTQSDTFPLLASAHTSPPTLSCSSELSGFFLI